MLITNFGFKYVDVKKDLRHVHTIVKYTNGKARSFRTTQFHTIHLPSMHSNNVLMSYASPECCALAAKSLGDDCQAVKMLTSDMHYYAKTINIPLIVSLNSFSDCETHEVMHDLLYLSALNYV